MSAIKIGALLRAYAQNVSNVSAVVTGMITAVDTLAHAGIRDVQIVVWAERNNPIADCGKTFEAMQQRLAARSGIHLHHVVDGDLFVAALNQGVALQRLRGITHSLILSWETAPVINRTLIKRIQEALDEDALVVGVALTELAEYVEQGAVMNTCALWDLHALQAVGDFDPLDAKPRETDHYAGESNAGVGEFLPMLAMVRLFHRPVLAVVRPTEARAIEVPLERRELQRKKIASKARRIAGMLAQSGYSQQDLRSAIMPGYPK